MFGNGFVNENKNTGFKGINTEAIPDAAEAVDIYVSDANKYLDLIEKEDDVSEAFRGNYAVAIKRFVNSVVEAARQPLRELEGCKKEMTDAAARYERKDDEMRSSIGTYQG